MSCKGCIYRTRLWGMVYCLRGYFFGESNEAICSEYKRSEKK